LIAGIWRWVLPVTVTLYCEAPTVTDRYEALLFWFFARP
jgi:hypothetical protein